VWIRRYLVGKNEPKGGGDDMAAANRDTDFSVYRLAFGVIRPVFA